MVAFSFETFKEPKKTYYLVPGTEKGVQHIETIDAKSDVILTKKQQFSFNLPGQGEFLKKLINRGSNIFTTAAEVTEGLGLSTADTIARAV